jgi:opacity protein-like surface antigen
MKSDIRARVWRSHRCGGLIVLTIALAGLPARLVAAELESDDVLWQVRFDMGGTIPQDARLTEYHYPVGAGYLRLSPGFQMDLALDYMVTRWLAIGGELGFLYNGVNEVGGFQYNDTSLYQIPMMANVTLRYPNQHRVVPYIGAGAGGVASALTFGGGGSSHYDYYGGYYSEPDGTGSTFTLGAQLYAGVNFRLGENTSLGVMYRYLYTESQNWDIEWQNNYNFDIGVGSIQVHSFCLVLSCGF